MAKKKEKNVDKWSVGAGGSLPIGFGLNLAANSSAMEVFTAMSDDEKQRVVDESRQQHSKAAMEAFVSRLGEGGMKG